MYHDRCYFCFAVSSRAFFTLAGERSDVVIKAQVLAGGRGLGTFTNGFHGGVHVVTRPQQAYDIASKMLGHNLITKQTGAEGRRCDKVFLVERLYLRKEMYLSIMLDRSASGPILIASSRGGTSIEDVAHTTPELIHKEPIDMMAQGLSDQQLNRVVDALGLSGRAVESAKDTIRNLYRMFKATDATMVEVNPLAETPDGKIVVADAKINFDDNAAFRQSVRAAPSRSVHDSSRGTAVLSAIAVVCALRPCVKISFSCLLYSYLLN